METIPTGILVQNGAYLDVVSRCGILNSQLLYLKVTSNMFNTTAAGLDAGQPHTHNFSVV